MKLIKEVIGFIDRNSIQTMNKVLLHTIISVVLGVVVGFACRGSGGINPNDFLLYAVMLSTISGVLFAASVTVSFFFASDVKNEREKNIDRIERLRGILRKMMEKEIQCHSEIANRLSDWYGEIDKYMPGQEIKLDEVNKIRDRYLLWVKESLGSEVHPIDFRDKSVLNSFWLHIRDSIHVVRNISDTFVMLDIGYKKSQSLQVFRPLVLTWVLIEVLLISSVIVGILVSLPSNLSLAIISASTYLFLITSFSMTMDILAIIKMASNLEQAWELAKKKLELEEVIG